MPHAPPPSNRWLLIIGGVMLGGVLILAWIGQPPLPVTIGQTLPAMDLQPLLEGTPPLAASDLWGKLTVIHFWGTWCPPCKEEYPEFAKLAAKYADHARVQFVSISSSSGPEYDLEQLRRQTQAFVAPLAVDIPTYADPAALTRERIAWLLPRGSLGYPTTLLVDEQGIIVHLLEGYYPGDMDKLGAEIQRRL